MEKSKDTRSRLRLSVKITAALLLTAAAVFALRCDIAVRKYNISTDKLSSPVRIVLLTDLHSSKYGRTQSTLINAIDKQNPDIILLGGDIADDKVPHERTWQLLESIGRRFPCYYVSGNHEYWSGNADAIKKKISSYGVTVLEGENITIDINGQKLLLGGIDDPEEYGSFSVNEGWSKKLYNMSADTDGELFSVLLSHRSEAAEQYSKTAYDLILCGHAHGGQVRLPYILNGLYAPNQGLFPKYAGGYYDLGKNGMIVSRGLCKDLKPRVFNRPEIAVVDVVGSRG